MNSDENNTYSCSVTGNRRAIWEINNRQISGQRARDTFSAVGVFVTGTLGAATTDLIFTREGRQTYLNLNQSVPSVPIRCTAIENDQPGIQFGEFLFITSYGELRRTHPLIQYCSIMLWKGGALIMNRKWIHL